MLLFRNAEFGHELGPASAGVIASGGADVGIATFVGASSLHRASKMVSSTPPDRIRTVPLANVVGDPDRMNSPNMRNITGTIAVRVSGLENFVVILPLAMTCG